MCGVLVWTYQVCQVLLKELYQALIAGVEAALEGAEELLIRGASQFARVLALRVEAQRERESLKLLVYAALRC